MKSSNSPVLKLCSQAGCLSFSSISFTMPHLMSPITHPLSSSSCLSCLLPLQTQWFMAQYSPMCAWSHLRPSYNWIHIEHILSPHSRTARFTHCIKAIWSFNWDMSSKQWMCTVCCLCSFSQSGKLNSTCWKCSVLHGNVCIHLSGWVCVFWPVVTAWLSGVWFPCGSESWLGVSLC